MRNKKNFHEFKYALDQQVWVLWPDNYCRHCHQPTGIIEKYVPRKGTIQSRTEKSMGEDHYEVWLHNSDFTIMYQAESEVFRTRKEAIAAGAPQELEVKQR
jgi:hypothetical protein